MASAGEFSLTPGANVTIGGVNVGENCPPGGLNDAIRYLAAAARDSYDRIPAADKYLLSVGGAVSGPITRQGAGAHWYHASASLTGGAIHILPEGSARPAAAEGVVVLYYT